MKNRSRYRSPKSTQCTLELCARAGAMLKGAGFCKEAHSRVSTATYYRWPDRKDVLRVSDHKTKTPAIGLNRIAAKITFGNEQALTRPGTLRISDEKVESMVAGAIGRYFLNSQPSADILQQFEWRQEA